MAFGLIVIIGAALLFVCIGVVVYGIAIFNGLIRLKNDIKKSWANIDVLLEQRGSELPKLINTVKGYMEHEKKTLEALTQARTAFLNAKTVGEKAEADNAISGALKTLFAVSENYPNLKANENFMQLQGRISGLENEIADRKEFYNDSVNSYNIRIQSFPDLFVARMLGYQSEEMFKVAPERKQDVEVKF